MRSFFVYKNAEKRLHFVFYHYKFQSMHGQIYHIGEIGNHLGRQSWGEIFIFISRNTRGVSRNLPVLLIDVTRDMYTFL